MYSAEYEKRWAELRDWPWGLLVTAACHADGHPADTATRFEYGQWSRHDLEKAILRSEFPAEASNG